MRFAARAETANPQLGALLDMDDAQFRARFAGTPVKRTGRDRFVRNVLVAAGNSSDASLAPRVRRLLNDSSPLVRGMAVWAFARLTTKAELRTEFALRFDGERDEDVRNEWMMELN
jgi:epoxyqueuosine reductase